MKPSGTDPPAAARKRKLPGSVKYYAVRAGHTPGVYMDWKECEQNITGFRGASFKSFATLSEAQDFVAGRRPAKAAATAPAEPTKFYAVARGRVPGIYMDWDTAQLQIKGWKGPRYKKFNTKGEAEEFIRLGGKASSAPEPAKTEPDAVEDQGFDSDASDDANVSVHPAKQARKEGRAVPSLQDNALCIYTDGSSLGNGKFGAVAGVGVFFGVGDSRNVSEPLQGERQTNQRAELTAILRALEIAPERQEVHIYTDSKYSISCVTEWYINWEKNQWLTALRKPVENKDLIQQVLVKIRDREVNGSKTVFNWVKGHSTDPGNEAADRLAVSGAQRRV